MRPRREPEGGEEGAEELDVGGLDARGLADLEGQEEEEALLLLLSLSFCRRVGFILSLEECK